MITIRPAAERGHARFGWLDSRHSFSFGEYYDPAHMGFGALRVINDDRVAPGAGFPTHGHRDMEIVSYVLDGALEHRDSLGTGAVIRPGEVQRMTAGTGIRHSEYNHSRSAPVHFLQIWIMPERDGLTPGYEQKAFADAERRNALRLVAARDGRDGAITIHQDVDLYAGLLDPQQSTAFTLRKGRRAWLQLARGSVTLGGTNLADVTLAEGDGAAITDVETITITGATPAEVLLFDLV